MRSIVIWTEAGWIYPRQAWYGGHETQKRVSSDGLWRCGCGLVLAPSRRKAHVAARDHRNDLWLTSQWFWDLVDKTDACWLYQGRLSDQGYGDVKIARVNKGAHIVAWELTNGPVPAGKELDHLCRVRRCVRPDHLEPVVHRENILRGDTFGARNAAKTECPQGHPYDDGNTYLHRGHRHCIACMTERARNRYRRAAA